MALFSYWTVPYRQCTWSCTAFVTLYYERAHNKVENTMKMRKIISTVQVGFVSFADESLAQTEG